MCEYCNSGNKDAMPKPLPKEMLDCCNLQSFVYDNGELDVWDFTGFKNDTFYINYCPMCGKKLGSRMATEEELKQIKD